MAQEAGRGAKETADGRGAATTVATTRIAQEEADRARIFEATGDAEKEKGGGGGEEEARRTVEATGAAEAARRAEAAGGDS